MVILDRWSVRWLIFLGYMILLSGLFTLILSPHELWNSVMDGDIPTSTHQIFLHNWPILFIFGLPYIGIPIALLSLGTNSFFIAISIHTLGLMHTLSLLIHLPLETFALVGMMRVRKDSYIKHAVMCSTLLLISAFLEVRLV